MEFDDFLIRVFTLFILLFVIPPTLQKNVVGDPISEILPKIFDLLPFIVAIGCSILILDYFIESTDVDFLETILITDLKFWEWGQRGYILFALSVIIVTTILNKPLGAVASVILFVISIHRLIQKFGKEKKERA